MKLNLSEIPEPPRIYNKYNIHEGEMPHVPVAVEDIAKYFTEETWQTCVPTIRTIGVVHRLENEFYVVKSVDKSAESAVVPLARGTNRELRVFGSSDWTGGLKTRRKKEKKGKKKKVAQGIQAIVYNKNTPDPHTKIKGLPFPDCVKNPFILGDTRVVDGETYMLLGRLQWANGEPIIDVHKFILINDLESSYHAFMLQYAMARRQVDSYKAHPNEIREIERRPSEKRDPILKEPQRKGAWKRKQAK